MTDARDYDHEQEFLACEVHAVADAMYELENALRAVADQASDLAADRAADAGAIGWSTPSHLKRLYALAADTYTLAERLSTYAAAQM